QWQHTSLWSCGSWFESRYPSHTLFETGFVAEQCFAQILFSSKYLATERTENFEKKLSELCASVAK
ncbi:MAG TPA: hypothetical protein PLX90_04280, partial [Anaerolineales bacterium]|nr:hypothetical protein [Anaerolineales bacterium]